MADMGKMDKVKHNNNVTYRCHYHVVWCPKYRRKVITSLDPKLDNPPIDGDPGPVDERLKQIIREVCTENGKKPDFLFPSLRRRLPSLWTNSYFVATVGGAPLSIVKQYVQNQRNV